MIKSLHVRMCTLCHIIILHHIFFSVKLCICTFNKFIKYVYSFSCLTQTNILTFNATKTHTCSMLHRRTHEHISSISNEYVIFNRLNAKKSFFMTTTRFDSQLISQVATVITSHILFVV